MSGYCIQHSHCSFCGGKYRRPNARPLHCDFCGNDTWLSPSPVAVALIPIGNGFLCGVRGKVTDPGYGELGLPGGFVEPNETTSAACCREVFEETGLVVLPEELTLIREVPRSPYILTFYRTFPRTMQDIAGFVPNEEVLELRVLEKETRLAFSSHTEVFNEMIRARTTLDGFWHER